MRRPQNLKNWIVPPFFWNYLLSKVTEWVIFEAFSEYLNLTMKNKEAPNWICKINFQYFSWKKIETADTLEISDSRKKSPVCLGIFLDQVKVQMVKIAFCQVWMQEIWIQFRILFLIQIGMSTDNNAEMTMVG